MSGTTIEVVLFDLGGVLIELDGVASMRALTGIASDEELWRRWLGCPWVRDFERGRCSPDDVAAGIVHEWELGVEPQAFLEDFQSWVRGPLPGAETLVRSVRDRLPVGCLSNTNVLHWRNGMNRLPLLDEFDFQFLSFRLGLLKPDHEVFDHVARRLPVPRRRVLFLDDNIVNVEAATDAGFSAHRVAGIADVEQALITAGVLDAHTGGRS